MKQGFCRNDKEVKVWMIMKEAGHLIDILRYALIKLDLAIYWLGGMSLD